MGVIDTIIRSATSSRIKEIERFKINPHKAQQEVLESLINLSSQTSYGKGYGIDTSDNYTLFSSKLPIVEYNDLMPHIEAHRRGERGILTTEQIKWYAKSSGTTASKSKYIPVPKWHLDNCHYRGFKDVVAMLYHNYKNLNMMEGNPLTLGGSHSIDELSSSGSRYGDLSAIMLHNAPMYSSIKRLPSKKVALIANFNDKVEAICRSCVGKNITSIAGVPSWNLVMLNKVLDYTGKSTIGEVWPNMEVFMHGGVNFTPYREEFNRIMGVPMKYIESYNASEGFFALQDDKERDDMLLMLDLGVYFEFLAMQDINHPERAVPLEGVRTGVNYAIIISTRGGLWRYMVGDTVTFTSIVPYRIKITGRTSLYINAFGEELIIDNTDGAIAEACKIAKCSVSEYTAAPKYMDKGSKGAHQWIIEFHEAPADFQLFANTLDKHLQRVNSDYEAKRDNNTTLLPPDIIVAPSGTFLEWMYKRGKTGGQNKVPRLSNTREFVDSLIELLSQNSSNE